MVYMRKYVHIGSLMHYYSLFVTSIHSFDFLTVSIVLHIFFRLRWANGIIFSITPFLNFTPLFGFLSITRIIYFDGLYCSQFSLLLFNFILFLCVLDYIYALYVTGMIIIDYDASRNVLRVEVFFLST